MSTKNKRTFIVTAYRGGARDKHSYVVGAFSTKEAAIKCAETHVPYRTGIYSCEVTSCVMDEFDNEKDYYTRLEHKEKGRFELIAENTNPPKNIVGILAKTNDAVMRWSVKHKNDRDIHFKIKKVGDADGVHLSRIVVLDDLGTEVLEYAKSRIRG